MNPDQFRQHVSEQGIQLHDHQMKQFQLYYETLVDWNKKINLTAITGRDDVYLKHFYDSLTAAFYVDLTENKQICDVGAGAGFPSIPLKIAYPHLQVTIVDSLKKRITFLDYLADILNLDDVTFIHSRAEMFGQDTKWRGGFDIVMARAVARLSVLSELCMPLTKQGGLFLSMKGAKTEEEIKGGQNAVKTLGGSTPTIHTFSLPEEESERSIIIIKKEKKTPKKYPRKPGTPMKNPIA